MHSRIALTLVTPYRYARRGPYILQFAIWRFSFNESEPSFWSTPAVLLYRDPPLIVRNDDGHPRVQCQQENYPRYRSRL